MLKAPQLRALADEPERFATELWRWYPTAMLPKVVDLLRDAPELLAAVREAANDFQRKNLELWLPRVIHPDPGTLKGFLALANRLAEDAFPEHPKLAASILTSDDWGPWGARVRRGESIDDDGIGWTLSVVIEIEGWANEIDVHKWTATAHHGERQLVLYREHAFTDSLTWSCVAQRDTRSD